MYGGGSGNGLYIVDARDPANPVHLKRIPTTQTGGFRIGPVHAIGNLLFLSSMDAQGASVMDISDPLNPQLLSVLSPTNSGTGAYASMVNGNRMVFADAPQPKLSRQSLRWIYERYSYDPKIVKEYLVNDGVAVSQTEMPRAELMTRYAPPSAKMMEE